MSAPREHPGGDAPRLAIAGVASVLLHAVVLWMIVATSHAGANPTLVASATERPNEELGLDRASDVSIDWIGFETPTDHSARPAEANQAALAPLAAPRGGAPAITVEPLDRPEPPRPQPETTPDASEPTDRPTPDPGAGAPDGAPAEAQADPGASPSRLAPWREAAATIAEQTADAVARLRQAAARATAEASRTSDDADDARAESARASAQPEASTPGAQADPTAEPTEDAIADEREADATSREILDYRPGRPLVSKGLKINTVRIELSKTQRVARRARYTAVVELRFLHNGQVQDLIWHQRSGHADIDRQIRIACFRWTAEGEALERLPPGDHEATIGRRIGIRPN